jgi:flagellar hook assembly protein FlgD
VSAYPNPFNPQTTVRYTLPSRGHVTLAVYDLRGEKVATLVNREVAAGAYSETWRGVNDTGAPVSSGVYFAKLSTPAGERSYKMVLLK